MRFNAPVIVADRGEYNITGRDGQDRQYPWVELFDRSGGGVLRASIAQNYTPNGELEVGAEVVADLELFARDGKTKLRLHGAAPLGTQGRKAA